VKPDAYLLDNYNIRGMHRDARLYKDVDLFTPASLSRLVNAWDPESGLGSRLYLIQLCFTAFTGLASVDLLRFSSSFSHSALPELLSIHVDASVVQTVIDA
jgi:hypothetical protein